MSNAESTGPVLAADGTSLKHSLARALRREKMRALMLIAPLLIFILLTFIAPIADMLFRSVENGQVSETLPRTVQEMSDWDPSSGEIPDENVFRALHFDLAVAAEYKQHTQVGTRLNYEETGVSSTFRRVGRRVDNFGEEYTDAFVDLNEAWEEPSTWVALMGTEDWTAVQADWAAADDGSPEPAFELNDQVRSALPLTSDIYSEFATFVQTEDEDSPIEEEPWHAVYTALYYDLAATPSVADRFDGEIGALLTEAAAAVATFEEISLTEAFIDADNGWGDMGLWSTLKVYSPTLTPGYFLNSIDLQLSADGISLRDEDQRIYATLFGRTLYMSMFIMINCILLGYPIAWLLSNLPTGKANLLLILVLLPFWTSLLVRTSAWKVLLQQQGVINDVLVWIGLVDDGSRLILINNQFGTIVAMTHILLPFMILPMFSVMQTIPPSYLRAAKSLGATNWTAFWRVYFPNSVPGIGAGSILVFILAIGYYITPELVGGTKGVFISNRIAYHISSSLNWGLGAALGTILLIAVLILYWAYDKIVGIDNVKLG